MKTSRGLSRITFFSRIGMGVAMVLAEAQGASMAQAKPSWTMIITVRDVMIEKGAIRLAVFDETSWGARPIRGAEARAQRNTTTLAVRLDAPGRYGVRLYHDVDGDGRLNTGMFGLPAEPYGFSNDAKPLFGPPQFREVAIDVREPVTDISIRLQH